MTKITKRGVLYTGFKCNLNCIFCFNKNDKMPEFYKLKELKPRALKIKKIYSNSYVDLYGGEPTVYPEIIELLEYLKKIGLKVSIATNGQKLHNIHFCRQLMNAGINDFLISVHGPEKIHNMLTTSEKAYRCFIEAVNNFKKLKIPFRTNTVVNKYNYKEMQKLAVILSEIRPETCNFIMFNPFGKWTKKELSEIAVSDIKTSKYLKDALEV